MHAFVDGSSSAADFCAAFMSHWRTDRDDELARAAEWPRRYDLDLVEALRRGEMTEDAFGRAWTELWGYAGHEQFHAMVDRVFGGCDAYEDEPDGRSEISESELRAEVEECLGSFELDERKTHAEPRRPHGV